MRLCVLGASKAIESWLQGQSFRYRVGFVTVTYADGVDWEPNHIRSLVKSYRQWCQRRGIVFRCVWVAELTRRGRVHYHLAFWLPRGITPPLPDKQGWWPHGMSNAQWAVRPVAYLAKYASKGVHGDQPFPHGCRLFGVAGSVIPLGWFRAPKWCRDLGRPGDHIVRRLGFWINRTTGFGYRSPWVLDRLDANGCWLQWVGWTDEDIICVA